MMFSCCGGNARGSQRGGESKPPSTRKPSGEIRNKKWQLAEILSHTVTSKNEIK